LEIIATRKGVATDIKVKNDPDGPGTTARKKEQIYQITVTNSSFKEVPEMELKYIIFLEREKLGSKAASIERVTGAAPLKALKVREKQTVETKDFALASESLAPGWIFENGGKVRTRESVKGIWVRLYRDGQLVNELVSPSSIAAKEEWRD
jgi:hypothetical protein